MTLSNNFEDFKNIVSENINYNKLFGMITFEKFPIEDESDIKESIIKGIRLILKKTQTKEALDYCKFLKQKGSKLFIQPTFIEQFSDIELIDIIK